MHRRGRSPAVRDTLSDLIHEFAQRRGPGLSRAHPTPINEISEISHMFDGKRFPSARRVSEHILTIPTLQ
jgi:hypothetical protein